MTDVSRSALFSLLKQIGWKLICSIIEDVSTHPRYAGIKGVTGLAPATNRGQWLGVRYDDSTKIGMQLLPDGASTVNDINTNGDKIFVEIRVYN